MSEETSTKKEEEIFGIPLSKLGAPALALGALGLAVSLASFFKPQIEGMQRDLQNRQAYLSQQQLLAAQAQQQQLQAQHQHQQDAYNSPPEVQQGTIEQPEQPQQSTIDQQYAVEQDPFNRHNRKVRIPEVDADGSGSSRFNNISI